MQGDVWGASWKPKWREEGFFWKICLVVEEGIITMRAGSPPLPEHPCIFCRSVCIFTAIYEWRISAVLLHLTPYKLPIRIGTFGAANYSQNTEISPMQTPKGKSIRILVSFHKWLRSQHLILLITNIFFIYIAKRDRLLYILHKSCWDTAQGNRASIIKM